MSKSKRTVITDNFKKAAVRLIATSGRTISQIAEDLERRESAVDYH